MSGAIVTRGGVDRRWSRCLCDVCQCVRVCQPGFDFYTREGDENGPLLCETCFVEENLDNSEDDAWLDYMRGVVVDGAEP